MVMGFVEIVSYSTQGRLIFDENNSTSKVTVEISHLCVSESRLARIAHKNTKYRGTFIVSCSVMPQGTSHFRFIFGCSVRGRPSGKWKRKDRTAITTSRQL